MRRSRIAGNLAEGCIVTTVPCLRCGALLPQADARPDSEGAGWYHPDCAGRWCYRRDRHLALVALHAGDRLVRGAKGWYRPSHRTADEPELVCSHETMRELMWSRRDGRLVLRIGNRAVLAPHLRERP